MKKFIFLAALCLATAARADKVVLDFTGTSPAAVSTVVGVTAPTEVAMFASCAFVAKVQGATGGTLDIFIQTFMPSLAGGMWTDTAHLTQLAAGGALVKVAFTLTRFSPSAASITAALNTADGTPALAANTIVPGLLGTKLRIVYVAGAGTSVGASQAILATCSAT